MNRLGAGTLAVAAGGLGLWLMTRPRQRYDFRHRVVIVTGGTRGLGLVLARQLVEAGARVAICGRDADTLQRAADDLGARGQRPLARSCDISDPEQVSRFVSDVETELGPIDVLINNAGTISVGPLETATRADYETAFATHFWGPYHVIEAVLPGMRQRRSGRIVNVSSIGGVVSVPHLVPYSASKFALTGYSLGLHAELAKDNIAVTCICPGLMRTGSPRNALFRSQHRKEYAWFTLSDAMPLVSMSAESAAAQILDSCRRGEALRVLSFPAKAAAILCNLFPDSAYDLLGLVNRLLPGPGGEAGKAHLGKDSESFLAPSILTKLSDRAAARNNEMDPAETGAAGRAQPNA
jgi:NAD(P)-dependent dehydrogenase (short-subunit alcohol dehydrogenase family)